MAAVLLGVIAAGWVVVPLVARRRALLGDATPAALEDVETRRRVALASLQDVEYDRISGKLDEHDYLHLKAQLEREALSAIEAVEAAPDVLSRAPGGEPAPAGGRHACGFLNPAGSRFCSGCGRRLG